MRSGTPKLLVGVDGGNTKTIAIMCDLRGRALGIGRGGSSNWEGLGLKGAADALTEVVGQALAMVGARREDLTYAHLGLAGMDWPDDAPKLQSELAEAGWRADMLLENDSFLTIRAGAPQGHGIGVTAGTGICAAIIRPDGEKYFYGGFTDLGGGYDTAVQTLQAVVRAEDGRGEPTALTGALLEATGRESAYHLVYAIHRGGYHVPHTAVNVALFATAGKGDPVAMAIVTRFGRELALCATNLIRRYGLAEQDPAVIAAGSRFVKSGPLLFQVFAREVLAVAPRAHLVLSQHPPVMGAVRGALAAQADDPEQAWQEARRSLGEHGWLRAESGGDAEGEGDGE